MDSMEGTLYTFSPECRLVRENPLPQNVRYYSLVAFTHRDNIQPGLLLAYDLLRSIGS